MKSKNIKIILSYDGTNYNGFQSQINSNTIEDTLKTAVSKITGYNTKLYCAGRTDTGVHAEYQVINFFTDKENMDQTNWINALNSLLPRDIRVISCEFTDNSFHARKSCIAREYWYSITNAPVISALKDRYSVHYIHPLNIDLLQEYCNFLIGTHDFTSFCALSDTCKSKVRLMYYIKIEKNESEILIKFLGNAFLHHMIRTIIGTILRLHRFEKDPAEMKRILDARKRKEAGPTYSAKGLVFKKAYYDKKDLPL